MSCLSLGLCAIPPLVFAQAQSSQLESQARYEIPAGTLDQVLNRFAAGAGILLVIDGSLTAGKTSQGLAGSYDAQGGLAAILSGSGLAATRQVNGSYALVRQPLTPAVTPPPPQNTAGSETPTLSAVKVTAGPEDIPISSANARNSTTATRLDIDPRQVPQSIGVVSGEVLEQIGARSAADAAYLVSGVSRQNWDGWNSGLVVRGFEIESNGLVDGMRNPRVSGRTSSAKAEDISLYERVEILKGHSSVLYGRGYVGGTVNFVTKKPLFERQSSVEGLMGSEDDYWRGTVDLTGPISDTVAYRLIGIAQNHDFARQDRLIASPSVAWKAPSGGDVLFNYTYSDVKFVEPYNAVLINGVITPYRRYDDLNADDESNTHDLRLTYSQPLGRNWKAIFDVAYSKQDRLQEGRMFRPNNGFISTSSQGSYSRQERDETGKAARAEVQGQFEMAATRHRIVAGYEVYTREQEIFRTHDGTFALGAPVLSPAYGAPNPAPLNPPQRFLSDADENGVYVADFIDFGSKVHALAGVRYASFEASNLLTGAKTTDRSATTPSIGLVYDFSDSLSGYVSAGRSFDANSGRDVAGNFFDPVRGKQSEAGLKGDAWSERFNYTVAAFKIIQDNVTTADPNNPGFSALLGEVEVKGLELDIATALTSRLSLISGLTFVDSEVTRNNSGLQGKRLGSTPERSGALRLSYLADAGWRFGGQVTYVSERDGSDFNRFNVPGYARVDLDASWETPIDGLRLQVNLENVTDRDYVSGSFDVNQITLGKPINATVRASYSF